MRKRSIFKAWLLTAGVIAFPTAAQAAGKRAREHAKPRALIFDASDAKKRPVFDVDATAPEKISVAPILFTTVSSEKSAGSDEPADVSITEKNLLLDQGKTNGAARKKK